MRTRTFLITMAFVFVVCMAVAVAKPVDAPQPHSPNSAGGDQ